MDYIIFDLEWNRFARAVRGACPDEIIQIGAVKYDHHMRYVGSFNCLIRPRLYHRIEPTVEKMTGLTIKKLEAEGVDFPSAFDAFRAFMGKKFVLMSWGMQDASVLRNNCLYYDKKTSLDWLSRYADLQRYASDALDAGGKQRQVGLKNAADCFPIEYEEETLHDALVDATLSGEVFVRIFNKRKFAKYIVDATEINQHYKNVHITDLGHKCVDQRKLRMRCPVCGKFSQKKRGWYKQGNKFVSLHSCKHCKTESLCSVEIFLTYGDEVKYKTKIKILENAESAPTEKE
ncbi:MAG: exonuclease domain-containing protein [Clostridia bacterium]|nr:exonuclease domain-containing protein [Clostridia bacterium]MBQ3553985.1 exonuclease domain-containing protein [Clostridia bacterium]